MIILNKVYQQLVKGSTELKSLAAMIFDGLPSDSSEVSNPSASTAAVSTFYRESLLVSK